MNSVKPKEEPTISQPIYQNENEEEDLFEDIVTDDEQIEENQEVELEQPKRRGRPKKIKAEQEAKKIVDLAKIEAENLKKAEIIKAKEEIVNSRKELDQEIKERRGEVQRQETRLIQKEENLERRSENFEKKEEDLELRLKELEQQKQKIETLQKQEMEELQRVAGLSKEEAKEVLLKEVEKQIVAEKAAIIREENQKAKDEVTKNAKELLTYAVQKCAADHSQETTVSIVALPSDEMKGRIIGREGRNIKALETLTGIDLIIDDTPEAVVISGFDPLRREVARIAIEKLIEDGRIHPPKIEEIVEKAKEEVTQDGKESDSEDEMQKLLPVAYQDMMAYGELDNDEKELFELWKKILGEAKQAEKYNPELNYGVYQITKELNTFTEEKKGKGKKKVYDYPQLNGDLNTLRTKLKEYYISHIKEKMFEYQLIK